MHEHGVDPSPLVVNPDWMFLGFMAVVVIIGAALIFYLVRATRRQPSLPTICPTVARTCANKISDR